MNISPPLHLYPSLRLACHALRDFPAGVTFSEAQPVQLDFNSPEEARRLHAMLFSAVWFEEDYSNRELLRTFARILELQKWPDPYANQPDGCGKCCS